MFDFYIQEDSRLYGIDWDGPIPYNENEITVPQTFCPLNPFFPDLALKRVKFD